MADRNIVFGIKFEADTSSLSKIIPELQKVQDAANKASTQGKISNELKKAGEEAAKLEKILNQAWSSRLGEFNFGKVHQSINKTYGGVKQFKAELDKAGSAGQTMYNKFATASLTANLQVKNSSKLLNDMAESMANTVRWKVTTGALNTVTGALQKSYTYAKKLDTSLNNIRIVTGKSSEEMKEFAKYANRAAQELGSSTTKYTDASLIYYQQGLSDAEVKARTDTTLKVANVTGMTAEAASENLTAVWNGYKVNARETELYMDKLSAVAATTASDLEELSVGMSKVASTANTVGVNIDQLAAQISTIISVTRQAPESVGTALKTIYARLGDLQVEGVDEFGTTLGEVSSKMETMGVSVLDETGELRNMGTVIEDVARKWGTWTTAQKNAAAIAMAGKRQYNNLFALFENWDMYGSAMDTSKNAKGTLEKQQQIYEESAEASLKKLSTEAERTYAALFDPESISGVSNALTAVLDKLNDFIEGIGGGTNALILLGATFTRIFNKQIASGITTQIGNFRKWRENVAVTKGNADIMAGNINSENAQRVRNILARNYRGANLQTDLTQAPKPFQEEASRTVVQNRTARTQFNVSNAVFSQARNDYENLVRVRAGLGEEDQQRMTELVQENAELAERNALLQQYQEIEREIFNTDTVTDEDYEDRVTALTEERNNLRGILNTNINISSLTQDQRRTKQGQFRSLGVDTFENFSNVSVDQRTDFFQRELNITRQQAEAILQNETATRRYYDLIQDVAHGRAREQQITERIEQIQSELNNELSENIRLSQETNTLRDERNNFDEIALNEQQIQNNERALSEGANIADTNVKIEKAVATLSTITTMIPAVTSAFNAFTDGAMKASERTNAFTSSISTAFMSISMIPNPWAQIIGMAGMAASSIIGGIVSAGQEANEKIIEDAIQTADEAKASLKNRKTEIQSLEELETEYNILAQGIDSFGQNISLSNESYERYLEISNQIAELSPDLVAYYDAEGNAILKSNNAIKEAIDLKKEENNVDKAKIANQNALQGYADETQSNIDSLNEVEIEKPKATTQIQNYTDKTEKELLDIAAEYEGYSAPAEDKDKALSRIFQETYTEQTGLSFFDATALKIGVNDKGEEIQLKDVLRDENSNITAETLENAIIGNKNEIIALNENGQELWDSLVKQYVNVLGGQAEELVGEYDKATKNTLNANLEYQKSLNRRRQEIKNSYAQLNEGLLAWAEINITETGDFSTQQNAVFQSLINNMQETDIVKAQGQVSNYSNLVQNMTEEQTNRLYKLTNGRSTMTYEEYSQKRTALGNELVAAGHFKNLDEFYQAIGDQAGGYTDASGMIKEYVNQLTDQGISEERAKEFLRESFTLEELATGSATALGAQKINLTLLEDEDLDIIQQYNKDISTAQKNTEKFKISTGASKQVVQSLTDALSTLESGKDLSETDLKKINELSPQSKEGKAYFEEWKKLRDKSSQDSIELMRKTMEAEEDASILGLQDKMTGYTDALDLYQKQKEDILKRVEDVTYNQEDLTELYNLDDEEILTRLKDDWGIDETTAIKLQGEIIANRDNFDQTIEEITNTKYEIKVSIDADLKSDVDEGFNIIDQVNEISDMLSKGLTISISDAQKMIEDGYGELLQNAETTSAGQILLNKEAVNSFVDARQQEIEAQRDAKLTQLKTEKLVLETQRDLQKQQLDLLTSGWKEKSKEEKAATLAKVHALSAEIDTVKSAANVELGVYAKLNEEQREQADKLYTYLTGQVQDQTDQAISAAEAQDRANKAMATNTVSYYQSMAKAAAEYNQLVKEGRTTAEAIEEITIEDGETIEGYESSFSNTAKDSLTFKTELDLTSHLLEADESIIDAIYDKTYTELSNNLMTTEQQIGAIDATIASLLSSSSYLDAIQANLKGAVGDVIDLLDDEIDRFHQIDVAINRVTRSLEDLKTQQEKLTGDSLVQSMELQLSVLDKQNELLNQKMQIAQQQANELAPILAAEGAVFDEQGSIANYVALLEAKQNQMNQAIMEYNAMSEDEQKANKEKKEQMDKDYEDFLKATEKYEEMVNETIPDLADEIQEIAEQQIELKIEQATVKVQVELDNIEYAKQYREYQNMRFAENDYTGKMEDMLQQYTEYFDPNGRGSTQIYSDRLQFLLDQKAQMDATGTASAYGDNSAKLKEDLAETYSNLIDAEKSLVDLEKNLWLTYLNGITNAFADNREMLIRNDEEFEHNLKLLTLIGGKNIEGQEKLYQLQSLNNQYLVKNAHSERKYWEDALEQAIANGEIDERIADIEEKANEARKQENEALISALEDLKQVFENRVTSLLDESFKGIEESSDQWEWAKKTESLYLDDINRLYEVQKLRNIMQSSIDETSNIKAQTQLREVMEEQLAILEKKEEVSKYDVDRANQLYDITLKQIALEDARNNKTQMRLRRDSQGNYNYQYIADENTIQNAEQELLNSINSLHNLNKERMTEMIDNIYSVTLELKEKLAEIATDETLTQEEKLAKMAETYEQYQEYIQELAEEQVFATNNLLEDTYTVTIPGFYATDAENFKHMINSNEEQLGYLLNWSDQIFKNMTDSSQQNFNAMSDAGEIAYKNLSDTQKNLLVETMLPEFNETILTMMNQFTQPGGFNDVTEDAYNRLIDLTQEYADEVEVMGNIAERNFDALRWGADEATGSIDKLKSQTNLANQELQIQIEKCHDLYWAAKDLSSAFGEINTDNLVADARETLLQWGETFNLMETMLGEWYNNSGTGGPISWTVVNGFGDYSTQVNDKTTGDDSVLEKTGLQKIQLKNDSSDGILMKGDTPIFKDTVSIRDLNLRDPYLNLDDWKVSAIGGKKVNITKISKHTVGFLGVAGLTELPRTHFETLLKPGTYDTGGYTGDWGTSEGKWAVLHEKEIVLNKEDTKNILSAVKVVRGLDNIINSLNQSIENKINYLQNKINSITNNIQIPSLITSPNDNFEQNVAIHAEFPNVEKVRDIEEAFNNLVNYATQVANRKSK